MWVKEIILRAIVIFLCIYFFVAGSVAMIFGISESIGLIVDGEYQFLSFCEGVFCCMILAVALTYGPIMVKDFVQDFKTYIKETLK